MKVLSDFNVSGLERILKNKDIGEEVIPQPYGQYMQSIFDILEHGYTGLVFLWVDLQTISTEYKKVLNNDAYDESLLLTQLEEFLELVKNLSTKCKGVIVTNFSLPPHFQGSGLHNLAKGQPGHIVAKANLALYEAVSDIASVWCLDQNKWFLGAEHYNGKLYHAGKIPFNQSVFVKAAEDICAGIKAIQGKSKKVLVLDLDHTLWGGILGDDGVDNLALGAPSPQGEAYVAFQKEIKALKNRGIILALASKNYEDNALNAISSHKEMQLRQEDFATWRINWQDKAQNIAEIAKELNVGLDSLVFIDDNPSERGRVSEELPEVFVPDWPESPLDYVEAFRKLNCFSVSSLSDEDKAKTEMFLSEKKRNDSQSTVSDKSEWLASLGMQVTIEQVNSENVTRIVQLLNKTNQFNLATRRLTQIELENWLEQGNTLLAFRLSDRYGDLGLIALLGLSYSDSGAAVSDFIMSCRVMGRGLELAMLKTALDVTKFKGFSELSVEYIKTDRNLPIFDFFAKAGFISEQSFSANIDVEYEISTDHFTIQGETFWK